MATWLSSAEMLKEFWLVMLQESLFAAVVFAAVWVICKMPRVSSPHLRMGLWHLVWLRFFLPVNFGLSLPSHPWTSPLQNSWLTLPRDLGPHAAGGDLESVAMNGLNPWLVMGLWLLSMAYAGCLFWKLRHYFRQRRFALNLLKTSKPVADPRILEQLATWRKCLGVTRKVRLVTAEVRISPMTAGWRYPTIFIPTALLYDPNVSLDAILGHEMAHIRRKDDLWLQVLSITRILFFFHPVAHWCFRSCELERERLCDALVLRRGRVSMVAYGHSLLRVLAYTSQSTKAAPAMSLAARSLAFRIRSLPHYAQKKHRPLWTMVALLLCAWVLLPLVSAQTPRPSRMDSSSWQHPLAEARETSSYGQRRHPISGEWAFHKGVDFSAARGTVILAPVEGVVLEATQRSNLGKAYGTVVLLSHEGEIQTFYSHLDRLLVKEGQKVERSQAIGTVGTTGVSTAPHLHFEVWNQGKPVNPSDYLPIRPPSP